LAGQNLHMEAKETEELLDWIAAEAGLEEVSFDLTTIKKCCKSVLQQYEAYVCTFWYAVLLLNSHSILVMISTSLVEILIKVNQEYILITAEFK
jgi:hypothetical protein